MNPLEELVSAAKDARASVYDFSDAISSSRRLDAAIAAVERVEVETRWEVMYEVCEAVDAWELYGMYKTAEAAKIVTSMSQFKTRTTRIDTYRSIVESDQ